MTGGEERLLTFEIGGLLFAMPIAGVLEVAEMGETACVPGVPPDVASWSEPQSAPGPLPQFGVVHAVPSARTAHCALQPWAMATALEVASFGASTHPAGSGR